MNLRTFNSVAMAEISETIQATEQSEKIDEFDPKTMRKTRPGVKRLIMILTVLASFILGASISLSVSLI